MKPYSLDSGAQVLFDDGERVLHRGWRVGDDGTREFALVVLPAADRPSRSSLDRLTHEYELKDELDGAWGVAAAGDCARGRSSHARRSKIPAASRSTDFSARPRRWGKPWHSRHNSAR